MSAAPNSANMAARPLALWRRCDRCKTTGLKSIDLEQDGAVQSGASSRVWLTCVCRHRWRTNVKRGEL